MISVMRMPTVTRVPPMDRPRINRNTCRNFHEDTNPKHSVITFEIETETKGVFLPDIKFAENPMPIANTEHGFLP